VLELFERSSGTSDNCGERFRRDSDGESCFPSHELVETGQQRTTSDERHSACGDVRGEFRRCSLEHELDRLDDLCERPLQRGTHLLCVDDDSAQQTGREVASGDLGDGGNARACHRGADLEFQAFRLLLSDEEPLLVLQRGDDRLVEVVTADANRVADDHAAQGCHRHLRRAATDIHDQRPHRVSDR